MGQTEYGKPVWSNHPHVCGERCFDFNSERAGKAVCEVNMHWSCAELGQSSQLKTTSID